MCPTWQPINLTDHCLRLGLQNLATFLEVRGDSEVWMDLSEDDQ